MSALAQAAGSSGARLLQVDFDQFVINPSALLDILRHFDIDATAAEAQAVLEGLIHAAAARRPRIRYDAAVRLPSKEEKTRLPWSLDETGS